MSDYSSGDDAEDLFDDFLHKKLNRPNTVLNRIKDMFGRNKTQTFVINNETFIPPDITVFKDKNLKEVEIRVEVKSFKKLPTRESPNRSLPLFPIKIRQLEEYSHLQAMERIIVKLVFVIGKTEKELYWCNINDVTGNLPFLVSSWDGEESCWYNIKDMNFTFDNF